MNKLCCLCGKEFRLPEADKVAEGIGFGSEGRATIKGHKIRYRWEITAEEENICAGCSLLLIIHFAIQVHKQDAGELVAGRKFGDIHTVGG